MSEQADTGYQGDIPGQNRCAYCGVEQTFPVSVSTPELLNRHPSKGRHAWGIKETSYTRIDASWELGGCWRRNTQRNKAISQMRLGTMGVLVSQVRVDTLGLLCRHTRLGCTYQRNIPSQGRHMWVIRERSQVRLTFLVNQRVTTVKVDTPG